MKKLFFAVVLTMFTSIMYAQVPAVNGLKGVQNVLRSMPNVIAGINKASNISAEVSTATTSSVSNTTGKVQKGTYDQMRVIASQEHPATPTPSHIHSKEELLPHLIERAVPATSQDSNDFYRAIARKVQAITDTIKDNE